MASGSSRASSTAWPCASRACRSIVLSESLSATMRTGSEEDIGDLAIVDYRFVCDCGLLIYWDDRHVARTSDKSAIKNRHSTTNQQSKIDNHQCSSEPNRLEHLRGAPLPGYR